MNKFFHKETILYAQLAFPLAFAGLPLYILAPDFYATQAGLSLSFMSLALLLIRLSDAVIDPLIGVLLDRAVAYKSWIVAAAVLVFASSFAALFNPLEGLARIWFVGSVCLATFSFSVLSIALNALGSLQSETPEQKASLSAWRESFGIVGLILAIVLPQVIGSLGVYALIVCLITLLSGGLFLIWLKGFSKERRHGQARQSLADIPFPRSIRTLYLVYGLSMLAASLPAALVIFFIRDRLELEKYTGLFLGLYFLAAIVGIAIWKKLALLLGYRTSWLISACIAIGAFSWAYFMGPGDAYFYGVMCLVTGVAFGGELFLAPTILSSLIDRDGRREATSVYYGLYAFLTKAAMALATAAGLYILDAHGFKPATANGPEALHMLSLLYAVIPAAIKIVACVILFRKGHVYDRV